MCPEVGDLISLPKWEGRFYRVVRVESGRLWVEFLSPIYNEYRLSHYEVVNNWIINRPEPNMEDTREYLEALSI